MSTVWADARPTPLNRGRALSFEEWIAFDEDEPGELVDGYLEEEEVPGPVHELAVTWLVMVLRAWLGARGFVLGSEVKLRLLPHRGRKPDLSVILPGSPKPPKHGAIETPPDIVVEIVTPTPRDERRDRIEKLAEYAAFGVRWYWLLDPALGSFEIFELDEKGRYARAIAATAGSINSVPGCEGLRLDLDDLWADLARLDIDEG